MTKKQGFFTIMGGRVKMEFGPYNPTSDAVWLAAFVDGRPKTVVAVGTGTGAVAGRGAEKFRTKRQDRRFYKCRYTVLENEQDL